MMHRIASRVLVSVACAVILGAIAGTAALVGISL